ncbi:Hypothetical predicted protein [Pelobates cultripes]|nr:Hypothetical predicted protein [Pelobates cultripes]
MSLSSGEIASHHSDQELEKTGVSHSKPPLKPKPVIPPHLRNSLLQSESQNAATKNTLPTQDPCPTSPPPDLPSAVKLSQLTGPLPYGTRRPSLKRWTSIGEREVSQESSISPLQSPIIDVTSKTVTNILPTLPKPLLTGTPWKGRSPFMLTSRGWGQQGKDIHERDSAPKRHSSSLESKDEIQESTQTVSLQEEHICVSSDSNKEATSVSEAKVILQHGQKVQQYPEDMKKSTSGFILETWGQNNKTQRLTESLSSEAKLISEVSNENHGLKEADVEFSETKASEIVGALLPSSSYEGVKDNISEQMIFAAPPISDSHIEVNAPVSNTKSCEENKNVSLESQVTPMVDVQFPTYHMKKNESRIKCVDNLIGEAIESRNIFTDVPQSASPMKKEQDQMQKYVVQEESLKGRIELDSSEQYLQDVDMAVHQHEQEKKMEWHREDQVITMKQQPQDSIIDLKDHEVECLPLHTRTDLRALDLPSVHLETTNLNNVVSDSFVEEQRDSYTNHLDLSKHSQHDVSSSVSIIKEGLQGEKQMDYGIVQPEGWINQELSTTYITSNLEPSFVTSISVNEAGAKENNINTDEKKVEEKEKNEHPKNEPKVDEIDTLFKDSDQDNVDYYGNELPTSPSASAVTDLSKKGIDHYANVREQSEHDIEKVSEVHADNRHDLMEGQPTDYANMEPVVYTVIQHEAQDPLDHLYTNHGAKTQHEKYIEEEPAQVETQTDERVDFDDEENNYVDHKDMEPVHRTMKQGEDLSGQHEIHTEMDNEEHVTSKTKQEPIICSSELISENILSKAAPFSTNLYDHSNISSDIGQKFAKEIYDSNIFVEKEPPTYFNTTSDVREHKYVEYVTLSEEQQYRLETQSKDQDDRHSQPGKIHYEITQCEEPLHRSTQLEELCNLTSISDEFLQADFKSDETEHRDAQSTNPKITQCTHPEVDNSQITEGRQLRYSELNLTHLHFDTDTPQSRESDLEGTYSKYMESEKPDVIHGESEGPHYKSLEFKPYETDSEQCKPQNMDTQSEITSLNKDHLDHPQDRYMKPDESTILDYEPVKSLTRNTDLQVPQNQIVLQQSDMQPEDLHYTDVQLQHRNTDLETVPHIDNQTQEVQSREYQSQVTDHLQVQCSDDHSLEVQDCDDLSREVNDMYNKLQEQQQHETDSQEGKPCNTMNLHDFRSDDTKSQELNTAVHLKTLENLHSEELQDKEESQRDSEKSQQLGIESAEAHHKKTESEGSQNEIQHLEKEDEEDQSECTQPYDFGFLEGTEVLDTAFMRCRASLGKKRCHRTPPQLPCTNEENIDPEYWLFRDSTENCPEKESDSEEKEETSPEGSPAAEIPVTSPGKSHTKKGGIFAGIINPNLLKGRLKTRNKQADAEAAKKEPEDPNLSPKSCTSPEKEGHSLNWLSALKKKKKKTPK